MVTQLKRLTLEMSLKPFKEISDAYIKNTVTELFHLWRYMIIRSESISLLLWVADGSEMLIWKGDLTEKLEWAKYVGFANINHCGFVNSEHEALGAKSYIENPPEITYGDIANIIRIIKETAKEMYGIEAEVAAAFDPGPEFAFSDFKYRLHPEILDPHLINGYLPTKADYQVVCPWSLLKGDKLSYAAFPNGIPDTTPFGTFFGKQSFAYMEAVGFDYMWFSNGFGYSIFPWTYQGSNFDGVRFGTGDYREMADNIIGFWDLFKQGNTKPVEVRGSNFSTGMEISKDCIPVKEFYDRGYLQYPAPNSPWGYLDYNFGVELGGYLTRISSTPSRDFPFRFYLDDPWFWQICWKHGFERQAHEIYGPMSMSRMAEDGSMEAPNMLEILSVDGERGVIDEQNTLEAIPHFRRAFDEAPDQPGILTLLYPFREHHAFAELDRKYQPVIFFNDWIVCNGIHNGLPLNTVVSTDVFKKVDKQRLKPTILLVPTAPLEDETYRILENYIHNGGKVLFYGSVEHEVVKGLLNIDSSEELTGEFDLVSYVVGDELTTGQRSTKLKHEALVCAGGMKEVVKDPQDPFTKICAVAKRLNHERIYALMRSTNQWNGGQVGWVRGSLPFVTEGMSKLPVRYSADYADGSELIRWILQEFGYTIAQKRYDSTVRPSTTLISRSQNAVYFSGYKFDSTEQSTYAFPEGAPVMTASSCYIADSCATYTFEKAFHYEARIFVKQDEAGIVTCRHSAFMEPTERKDKTCSLEVSGLRQATVTVYPPLSAIRQMLVEAGSRADESSPLEPVALSYRADDTCIVIEACSGQLEISW